MAKNIPARIIVVATHDPNICDELINVVVSRRGVEGSFALRSKEDWEILPPTGLFWAFVDCGLVDQDILSQLSAFEHVLLFNYKINRGKITRLLRSNLEKKMATIDFEDHMLTASLLEKRYSDQITESWEPVSKEIPTRVCSVSEEHNSPIYSGPVPRSWAFSRFLDFLRSGIAAQSYSTLLGSFTEKTSETIMPKSQKLTQTEPSDVQESIEALKMFALDPDVAGKGCFLIGKKGAGKSTIDYYVGRTLDKEGKVCCVGVDYTLETHYDLHGRLLPLLESFNKYYPEASKIAHKEGFTDTDIFEAGKCVSELMRTRNYSQIQGLTASAESTIMLEADRGFLVRMYCYYEKHGTDPELASINRLAFEDLVYDAGLWYDSLKQNSKKLFVYYLNFLLNGQSMDSLRIYTYRSILRYILTIEEHREKALEAFQRAFISNGWYPKYTSSAEKFTAGQAIVECLDLPLSRLREVVLRVLGEILTGRPLLLLLDNLDQRTSPKAEARGIYGALRVFKDEINDWVQDSRVIVSIRDTTLHSQDWARISFDVTKGWRHIYVLSPDFLTVLRKRCVEWQRRGIDVGRRGYREAMNVVKWVSSASGTTSRDGKSDERGLIEIITHRHPFNVREQLRTFARCCENVFLHREWLKSHTRQLPWPDKSYEFYLRVFLLGELRFFTEDHSEIINIYDNGYPQSVFNACLRSWLLCYLKYDVRYSKQNLIRAFASAVSVKRVSCLSNRL